MSHSINELQDLYVPVHSTKVTGGVFGRKASRTVLESRYLGARIAIVTVAAHDYQLH